MNITPATLDKLAQLLCCEALQEREVDFHKQVLIKHPDFVLLNVFENICSAGESIGAKQDQHQNSITSLDLVGFFKQNSQIISERDCYLLVTQYDSNHDGKLSLTDFQLMITPSDFTLKQNITNTQKHYSYGGKTKQLSYDVEVAVLMVFQRMIEGLKIVEQKKQELITSYDWSGLEAFRVIDEYSHGNINNDNLRVFLMQYDCFASVEEEDITRLIRKYDKDSDRALSFREFITAINPRTQYSQKAKDLDKVQLSGIMPTTVKQHRYETDAMKENMRPSAAAFSKASKSTTAMSVYRGGQDALSFKSSPINPQNQEDNLFNMRNIDSALDITPKGVSFSNHNTFVYKSSVKGDEVLNYPYMCDEITPSNQRQELQFADKIKQMSVTSGKQEQPMLKPMTVERESYGTDYKTQLIQAFIDMMQVEGSLEKKKRELAMRQDFNLTDAFKMFNSVKNHRRGIDVDDLYYVLKEYLKLTLSKDEVFILFYKLDRDGDGYINYTELSNAFIPNQHEYAVLIQSRPAFHGGHIDPREYFTKETRDFLRRSIRGLVDCEVSIELIKQRIYQKIRLNCETAFHQIDRRGKGMVTLDDLRDYLKSGNVFAVEKELQLLFQRFDKDENGLITLPEFVAGISPFMNNRQ